MKRRASEGRVRKAQAGIRSPQCRHEVGRPAHPLDIEAAKRSQWRAQKSCVEGHDRKFDSRLRAKHPSGVCSGCNGKQEAGRKAGRNTPCGQKHEGRSAANGMCYKRVWCSQKKIKKESLPPENSHDKKYRRYIFSIRRIENMTLNNPENAIHPYLYIYSKVRNGQS